jgi:hypothetical protein
VTRSSASLLDTDNTPASFWITHPTNYFSGNVAAGSQHYGFWFDLQSHATGPSTDTSICPRGSPVGSFENNRAHSNGRYGLRIFNEWIPRADPCGSGSGTNPLVPTELVNFTSYKNGRSGAIGSKIGDIRFRNFRLADNQKAGIEVTDVVGGYRGGPGVYGALIIAASENQRSPRGIGVWLAQSENFTAAGTTVGLEPEP